MSAEDINVEAGLTRDHELRMMLTVCRYALAAIVCLCALLTRCQEGPADLAELHHDADAMHSWKAQAEECKRWTP